MSKNSSYRLQYYEDDVVIYTDSGKHPKLPQKYKTCNLYWGHHKHTFKCYYTPEHANIALRYASRPMSYYSGFREDWKVFYCPKCCMYHVTTEKNYNKYVRN